MKPSDRARLTAALREHVANIAADLRVRMRAPGETRVRAQRLHADEQVAEDFDVWTDLLSRRAAVLWVLKSVYVRVLEDRGLLSPGRILDPESQQLFENLAPHLGETAFLSWVYRDLASRDGGLPELFCQQAAEVTVPSNALSRELIAFWRHRDADTGIHWGFAEERFDGELMGDLYQDLDPVVKDRFDLLQTPAFVRSFILDRTLGPSIAEFGASQVRVLDPACGSGHFLIDTLKRLVAACVAEVPRQSLKLLVAGCLERVVGIDLNDYACALARARLVMTAAELAGVGSLAEAAVFQPRVFWADGLEQVEREPEQVHQQLDLLDASKNQAPLASLTRTEGRAAVRDAIIGKFHVVIANPPYGAERDSQRRAYHREKVAQKKRYVSAHKEYSLCAPFIERCFQLGIDGACVGVIAANNFVTRDFGKHLVESVLAGKDLRLVVDLSGAILAESGFETPTIILIARNERPAGDRVRVVLGKKGDTKRIADASQGDVWRSVVQGWDNLGFENDYVSVVDLLRTSLARHPWSLRGGGALELKERIERKAAGNALKLLVSEIGFMSLTRADEVYFSPQRVFRRAGIPTEFVVENVEGQRVRDWQVVRPSFALFPYTTELRPVSASEAPSVHRFLWPYRTLLWLRREPNGNHRELGLTWWEWSRLQRERFKTVPLISFAAVATHNHFARNDEVRAFKQTAPVVVPKPEMSDAEFYQTLGFLNSSVTAFWLRQVLHKVGGRSSGTKRQSEVWAQRMDLATGIVSRIPLPKGEHKRVSALAKALVECSREIASTTPQAVLRSDWSKGQLSRLLEAARKRSATIRARMVALQEELDWATYVAFGLVEDSALTLAGDPEPIESSHRAFAIGLARSIEAGRATSHWFEAMGVGPALDLPVSYSAQTRAVVERRLAAIAASSVLAAFEVPEYKRKWEPLGFEAELLSDALDWLSDSVEDVAETRSKPWTVAHLAAQLQAEERFLEVARVYENRPDIDVEKLVAQIVEDESVPQHRFHVYTDSGLSKRSAWEATWALQRAEDLGGAPVLGPVPPEYSQGSRGKSTDFLRLEYWHLRGKLDVRAERFVVFSEVPGRSGKELLCAWAGWTPLQRARALLSVDAGLEDEGISVSDRAGLLDSAWRLLDDAAYEDGPAATRLKAELRSIVGPGGPSAELVEQWRTRFPPPTKTSSSSKRKPSLSSDGEDLDS